jgi:kynurenine formamidase
MRIRTFVIAYALVLAILLFADRRHAPAPQNRYSHVVDLTDGESAIAPHAPVLESRTRIIAPGALIPGTWTAGQIPAERLVAPLVVMDLKAAPVGSGQISLDDIAAWEAQHGMVPQGAVVAIRRSGARDAKPDADLSIADPSIADLPSSEFSNTPLPIDRDAALFLVDARYTIGFAVETPVNFSSDRSLARQLALHGSYVLERAARFAALPATGSLIVVAPEKNKKPGEAPVRILAMVR